MRWKLFFIIYFAIAITLAKDVRKYEENAVSKISGHVESIESKAKTITNTKPSDKNEKGDVLTNIINKNITTVFNHIAITKGNNEFDENENQGNQSDIETENASKEYPDNDVEHATTENVPIEPAASLEITDKVILTENGPVIGFYMRDSTDIRGYFDIPYGAVTGLFAPPGKPQLWEEIHQASSHSKRCPQIENPDTYVGDLDCLTLSIFKHSDVQNAPVLFHVHDGDLQTGSGDPSIYGPDNLVSRGVILVLPNYRLGPLGFLCLQNEMVPGNAGLKDLALALEWTVKNIADFGGDASNIAVSGDGKAGALVGLLALSPTTSKYISKVITESGSVLSPTAIDRNPIATAAKLAETVRENGQDISADIDLKTLVLAAKGFDIRPCIERGENAFLNKNPWEILKGATNIDKVFMIGSATHAGLSEALEHNESNVVELNKDFSQTLPEDLKFTDQEVKKSVGQELKKHYFGNKNFELETGMDKLSLYYTDSLYLGPSLRYARYLYTAGATVFFYEFAFVGDMNRALNNLETSIKEATRGDITGYVFTQDGALAEPDTDEAKMADLLADLWINFLKNGKPSSKDVQWDKFKASAENEEKFIIIDLKPEVQNGVHIDRLSIWSALYKNHYIGTNNLGRDLRSLPYSFLITLVCLCLYH